MFEKILYPIDFSDLTGKTIQFVKALKKSGAKEVILMNVIHQRVIDTLEMIHSSIYFQDGRYQEDTESALKKIETDRLKKMAPISAELEDFGFQVKTRIEKGFPVKEILKVEQEEDVSVIVIGSHGRNNIKEALMGSVSEKVVRRAKKPVLIVKR